jgi:hypothetical protein
MDVQQTSSFLDIRIYVIDTGRNNQHNRIYEISVFVAGRDFSNPSAVPTTESTLQPQGGKALAIDDNKATILIMEARTIKPATMRIEDKRFTNIQVCSGVGGLGRGKMGTGAQLAASNSMRIIDLLPRRCDDW